jgi:hypothetical protein
MSQYNKNWNYQNNTSTGTIIAEPELEHDMYKLGYKGPKFKNLNKTIKAQIKVLKHLDIGKIIRGN